MKYTLITLAALSGAAFAQTIVNGDFSNTSGMQVSGQGAAHSGIPFGWTTDGATVDVMGPNFLGNPAGFGGNFLDTNDMTQPITISQVVSGFEAGKQYTLSYDWGNSNWDGHSPYDMTISMGGSSADHKGPAEVVAPTANSFTFIASGTTETLSVTFNHTNGDSRSGFNSTNFRVTPAAGSKL